jgi:uncharacterized protein YndB with AHSA1/START domain
MTTKTEIGTGTGSVRVSRVIKAPPERVFNAFLDAEALGKFLPPAGYTGRFDRADGRLGGKFHGSFTSLDKKDHHEFGGTYVELKPFERIVHTDKFDTDHPDLQGEMRITITFKKVPDGTEVTVLHEGIPKAIPVESAQIGWTSSLENLANLVELPEMAGRGA